MQVSILGPLLVEDGGRAVEVGGARLRALLIRLSTDPGRWVSVGLLVDALWAEEPPSDEVNALQSLVSRLRRALPVPGSIESGPAGYRLVVPPDAVDAVHFEQLVAAGRRRLEENLPGEASSLLGQALELWRGDPLPEVADAPYAIAGAQRLRELRLAATEDRAEADSRLGRHRDVIAGLEPVVAAHPLRERAHGLLIRALSAAGRGAEAIAAYDRLRATLADELGLDPSPELQALHLSLLRGEPQATPAETRRPVRRTNLRASLTSFIGREEELARLREQLTRSRLVTLVGAGGAGKTRLAGETAAGAEVGQDGVWIIELAPVSNPADIPAVAAGSIGARERALSTPLTTNRDAMGLLLESIGDRDVLLILDNCEHLVDAAAAFAEQLLGQCPRLRMLATSREPLGILGESLWPVRPLPGPDPDSAVPASQALEQALGTSAVQLFADRAALVRPGFTVHHANLAAVTEICHRLDGLPLAIELAAARLRTMPVEAVAARLGDRFRLLTGGSRTAMPRHQTLRAVVAWSWDLLTESERRLAERMSVFPGGADVRSVEVVCASGEGGADVVPADSVLDLLATLADKSLLVPVDGPADAAGLDAGQPRYRMLETIREFSTEKLGERGETFALRAAHARWYLALAEEAEPKLRGPDQVTWLRRLSAERENFMAALRFAGDTDDAATALRLGAALAWYWTLLGRHDEATNWLRQALDVKGDDRPASAYAVVWTVYTISAAASGWGWPDDSAPDEMLRLIKDLDVLDDHPLLALVEPGVYMLSDDDETAQAAVKRNLRHRDPWARAMLRLMSGAMAENDGDLPAMGRTMPLALEEFRRIGDRWGIGTALGMLAGLYVQQNDLEKAVGALEEARRMMRELRAHDDEAYLLMRTGMLRARLGDFDAARADILGARRVADETGAVASGASARLGESMLARHDGRDAEARRLVEEALRMADTVSFGPPQMRSGILCGLVHLDVYEGRLGEAAQHLADALVGALASRDMPITAVVATSAADVALAQGDPSLAATLLGAGESIRGGPDASDLEERRIVGELLTRLGSPDHDHCRKRGASLERPDAIALLERTIAAWSS